MVELGAETLAQQPRAATLVRVGRLPCARGGVQPVQGLPADGDERGGAVGGEVGQLVLPRGTAELTGEDRVELGEAPDVVVGEVPDRPAGACGAVGPGLRVVHRRSS